MTNMEKFLSLVEDEPIESYLRRKDRLENHKQYMEVGKVALKILTKLREHNLPKESVGIDLTELDLIFKTKVKEISNDNMNKINDFFDIYK